MKKLLLFISLILLAVTQANAQSWLDKVGKKVENSAKRTIERKAEQKTEQAVGKAVDKATDKDTYKGSEKDKNTETDEETETEAEQAGTGKSTGDKQGGDTKSVTMAYMKSDFVPGDEIFFEDNLANEKMGEFPSQWDLINGVSEVAEIDGVKAINFEAGARIAPLMKDMSNYLPDVFTVEFDFWINDKKSKLDQQYELGFYQGKTHYSGDDLIYLRFGDLISEHKGKISWIFRTPSGEQRRGEGEFEINENSWHHFSVSFNQRAFKAYVNGIRVINIPNVAAPKTLAIDASNWGGMTPGTMAITNMRMAKGAVPLYDRMINDGKFISYGITFDVGKATIKPESYGELNRIVVLMNEKSDLRFSVEGHTDSTGGAELNQKLSDERSKAVMNKLIEMGIAQDRLQAVGKGQNSPIADNSTDEGRAKNRRVEFVKQ
ncbi:OmpA family protein [Proteiniphilum sp.]|uniref:OmpA family protein n=1 Tax=Proteiniphilum sp. TaxID=1926877 RepID=UPI002B203F55|nr:OmpA family protein [Proteiniphilum sp.]MEA4916032.1 OmpA family protein [Proteiniphilum sp.]